MNEVLNPPDSAEVPAFKDRRTGLIVFGVLQILFGALCVLMILLMVLGQVMASKMGQAPLHLRQMIPGAMFYAIAAATLVVLGIGSCQVRRWARALSLVVSWSWLVLGVVSLAAMILFLPSILKAPQAQGQALPETAKTIMLIVSLLMIGIFFIVVPGGFVLFFQSRHVKATCETFDPVMRWTDACPLPVLALSLWLAFTAVSFLAMPFSMNGVLPAFGRLVSGPLGMVCHVILAGLAGYVAWATYRLRPVGWWMMVAGVCAGTTSAFLTFTQIDLAQMYLQMGYPEQQIEMMKQYSFMQGNGLAYFSLAGLVPMLGYLLFVKRYFRSSAEPGRVA